MQSFFYGASLLLASVVFYIMKILYQIFFTIATKSLFSNAVIDSVVGRVWALIGIIMIFKLAISLINYMVNPDEFSNEKTGFGKVIQRVLISLLLLGFCKMGFTTMYRLQALILQTDIIPSVIMGSNLYGNEQNGAFKAEEQSELLVEDVFHGAFQVSKDNTNASKINEIIKNGNLYDLSKYIDGDGVKYYMFLDSAMGAFIDYVLLLFCLDIAVRSVKLSFYQLLAPIPIILYIDPKKGDERIQSYLKAVGGTFATLFEREAIIYIIVFAVYLLTTLFTDKPLIICDITATGIDDSTCGFKNVNSGLDLIALAFIIMGLFMFAKQAPQLIKDVTGLDFDKNAPGLFSFKDREKAVMSSTPWGAEAYAEREKHRLEQRNTRRQQAREARQNRYMERHGITDSNDPRNLEFLGNIRHPIAARRMRQAQNAHTDATNAAAAETTAQENATMAQNRYDNLMSERQNLDVQLEQANIQHTAAQAMQTAAKADEVASLAALSSYIHSGGTNQDILDSLKQTYNNNLVRRQTADAEVSRTNASVAAATNNIRNVNSELAIAAQNVRDAQENVTAAHTATSAAQKQERIANTAANGVIPVGAPADRKTANDHASGH